MKCDVSFWGQVACRSTMMYSLGRSSADVLKASWKANILCNPDTNISHAVTGCLLKFLAFQGFPQNVFAQPKNVWTLISAGSCTVGLIPLLILFAVGHSLSILCQILMWKYGVEIREPFYLTRLWHLLLPVVTGKWVDWTVPRGPAHAAGQSLLTSGRWSGALVFWG